MGAARTVELAAVTCTSGKVCFRTHECARRHARFQMVRQRHVILNVYRCLECHGWHMTSSPQLKDFQTLRYLRMRREVSMP